MFPKRKKLVDDMANIVIKFIERGFLGSQDDANKAHIFQFVPNTKGEVQAHDANDFA